MQRADTGLKRETRGPEVEMGPERRSLGGGIAKSEFLVCVCYLTAGLCFCECPVMSNQL